MPPLRCRSSLLRLEYLSGFPIPKNHVFIHRKLQFLGHDDQSLEKPEQLKTDEDSSASIDIDLR